MFRHLIISAALAACCGQAIAQTTEQLQKDANQAYAAREYARSAALYERAFKEAGNDGGLQYNAACAHALAGDRDAAFRALRQAMEHGYASAASTEKDEDFTGLRGDPRWLPLLAEIKAKEAHEGRLFNSPAIATPYAENISDDEKVAGLSKFWSEVKYNFVYVEKLKEIDWDRLYLETIPKVRATRTTAEYYRVLMALCARLEDGHTNVYPSWQVWNSQLARPKIRTWLVENKVLVREVMDPALREQGVVPGVEILAVDGEPVRAYVQREIEPYTSASTIPDRDVRAYGYFFLAGPLALVPKVTFRDAQGRMFDAPVQRYINADLDKVRVDLPPFELRMLPGGVAYVALNSFGNQKAADGFIAAFPEIARSSALVIDVRNNGGGNSDVGYRVLATLASQPFLTSKWDTRQYLPSYRAWKRPMPNHAEAPDSWAIDSERQYRKPVVVLTSAATYSAAEDFAVAFDAMKRGAIVGQATGGSTGQPLFINLPGGGTARICTKRDTYPDGRMFVGVGVQPGVRVAPTVADLRKGRDTVLEAALAHLRKQ